MENQTVENTTVVEQTNELETITLTKGKSKAGNFVYSVKVRDELVGQTVDFLENLVGEFFVKEGNKFTKVIGIDTDTGLEIKQTISIATTVVEPDKATKQTSKTPTIANIFK